MAGKKAVANLQKMLILLFLVLSVLLFSTGVFFFRHDDRIVHDNSYEELRAIAELKTGQIANWLNERRGDVTVLAGDPGLISLMALEGHTRDTVVARLQTRLYHAKAAYGYQDAMLSDTNGNVLVSTDSTEMLVNEYLTGLIHQVATSQQVMFSDFYRMKTSGAVVIDVLAPVINASDVVTGVVILREDPNRYLYPLIQSWPIPSASAETLIVREDKGEVLFLNELRHRPNSALNLRIPITRPDLPAAMAISDQTGRVEGVDYRGVPVMADIRPIPGSPWFMVAKVDKSELLSEARFRKVFIIAITVLAILLAGALISIIFFIRQRNLYRDLHAAELSLDEAREWFRTTLYSIGDAVITADTQKRILQMNAVAEALTGWDEKDAVGKPIQEIFRIVNEETRSPVEDPVEKVLREGVVVGLANHTILIAKDGTEFPIADSGAPIQTRSGDIQGAVLVFRDQTLERSREKQLRDSEEKLRMALQSGDQEIFNLELQIGVDLNNPESPDSSEALPIHFRKTFAEWNQRIHPDDRNGAIAGLWDYVYGRVEEYRNEYRVVTDRGEWRWYLAKGKIVKRDDAGRPMRMMGTRTDITELKNLEQQYLQAQKMEAVGRLAGGVAHDFNNMLNVILGYSELAMGKLSKDGPAVSDLDAIKKAALRSAELTKQLLAFARRQTIMPRALDLDDVISKSEKMMSRLIGEDIHLQAARTKDLWSVKMDVSQIEQILMNLAVNARDAIAGVGKISIETGNVTFDKEYCAHHAGFRPGQYVMVSFSDSGKGMDRETMDRIFEPFFTTKAEGKGTGLGLSTVYGIIKQNEGFINVYSEPGMGTTFKLFFPRHEGTVKATATVPDIKDLTGIETILVVEDEPQILLLCRRMLEALGYTVLTAKTPEEALSICENHTGDIHLLLTDVVMPGMSGKALQERIIAFRPGIKTLFMSGYTANVIAHHGILAEGIHFLQKPFSRNDLAKTIREVLD